MLGNSKYSDAVSLTARFKRMVDDCDYSLDDEERVEATVFVYLSLMDNDVDSLLDNLGEYVKENIEDEELVNDANEWIDDLYEYQQKYFKGVLNENL